MFVGSQHARQLADRPIAILPAPLRRPVPVAHHEVACPFPKEFSAAHSVKIVGVTKLKGVW